MRRGGMIHPRTQISVRDVKEVSSGSSAVIPKPSVVDGSFMFAIVACNQNVTIGSSSSLFNVSQNGANGLFMGGRAVPSAASETATNYTFIGGVAASFSGTIISLDGVDLNNPIADIDRFFSSAAANNTMTAMDATEDGQLLYSGLISTQTPTVSAVPIGMTSIYALTGARGRWGAVETVQEGPVTGRQWSNTAHNGAVGGVIFNPIIT